MVSTEERGHEDGGGTPAPVVLSEGAGIALGSVFNRLVKRKGDSTAKDSGKRPRSGRAPVVLAESEEVRESLARKKEENKRLKQAKKARLQFETNGRVVPDAATDAALEKELLETATTGAVALFNAVSKAQKAAEERDGKAKMKGPPVSRESFMNMMRAGVNKSALLPGSEGDCDQSGESEDGAGRRPVKSKAMWLKDDFLTAGSKKLKDWDKEGDHGRDTDSVGDESEDESEDEVEDDGDSEDEDESSDMA